MAFLRRIVTIGWIALISFSCAVRTSPYNPFQIDQDQFRQRVKTIAVAPFRMPESFDDKDSVKEEFESLIEAKLKGAGYSVVPARIYGEVWQMKLKEAGGYFDTRTGEADEAKYKAILEKTKKEIQSTYETDFFLYSGFRIATPSRAGRWVMGWDGATESVWLDTRGAEKDKGAARALSLLIRIEDLDGAQVYLNAGGIQLLTKLKKKGPFTIELFRVPDQEILIHRQRNEAAVEIALGPLVGRPTSSETQK